MTYIESTYIHIPGLTEALAQWDKPPFNSQTGIREIMEAARQVDNGVSIEYCLVHRVSGAHDGHGSECNRVAAVIAIDYIAPTTEHQNNYEEDAEGFEIGGEG